MNENRVWNDWLVFSSKWNWKKKQNKKRWSALSTRVWHQSVGLFVFRSFSYGMAFEIVPLCLHSIQIEITNKNYFEHKSLLLVICTENNMSELQGFLWVIFHTSLSEACIHLWDRKIIEVSSIIFHFIRSFITCAEVFSLYMTYKLSRFYVKFFFLSHSSLFLYSKQIQS